MGGADAVGVGGGEGSEMREAEGGWEKGSWTVLEAGEAVLAVCPVAGGARRGRGIVCLEGAGFGWMAVLSHREAVAGGAAGVVWGW